MFYQLQKEFQDVSEEKKKRKTQKIDNESLEEKSGNEPQKESNENKGDEEKKEKKDKKIPPIVIKNDAERLLVLDEEIDRLKIRIKN